MELTITPNVQNVITPKVKAQNYVNGGLQYRYGLNADTVSFGSGEKLMNSMKGHLSTNVVGDIADSLKATGRKVHFTLKRFMKPLIACSSAPGNAICAGEKGIKFRVKDKFSMQQKGATREFNTKEEIYEMGDALGHRIVLRDASPKNVEKVLKQLAEAVKQGELTVVEIENYRLPDGTGYATPKMLEKLASVCNKNNLKTSYDKRIPSGYPAIHIGFKEKIKGSTEDVIGEIQIMGKDVEDLKEYDDIIYKLMCNKPLKPKYKEMQDLLMEKIEGLSEDQKKMFMQYRRDSFIEAFKKETMPYNTRKKSEFIDIPYFLPKELGYKQIAEMLSKFD